MSVSRLSLSSYLFLFLAILMYFFGYGLVDEYYVGLNFYIAGFLAVISILLFCINYHLNHNATWWKAILVFFGLVAFLLVVNIIIIFVGLLLIPSLF